MAGKLKVGVLALQGAVEPHQLALRRLGVEPVQVRKPDHLLGLSGIILPGGESTTMLHLLHLNHLWEPLQEFTLARPVLGVCAGAILLAQEVTGPAQASLGAVDITIERNAFGRQVDSFTAPLVPTSHWKGPQIEGVFIRAPRIRRLGPEVKVLFEFNGEPVMVEQGKRLAASFHPELTDCLEVHRYFMQMCTREQTPWMTVSQKSCEPLSLN